MDNNEMSTNFDGIRLVLDTETLEFYLFADRDKPGLISGKLDPNTTQVKYHVKRGDKSDGKLTGYIHVIDLPFEAAYYQPQPGNNLLTNNTYEVKVNDQIKYERFHPDLYESGVERNPPRGLNSKAKKRWHKECTAYLQAKEPKSEVVKAEEPKEIQPVEETKPKEVESNPVLEAAIKEQEEQTKKSIHGQGNKECLMRDYPEGYIIAHSEVKDNVIVILGTPNYPDSGLQRFLVFPSKKQAAYAFQKLGESEFYKNQIVDGIRKFEIYPSSAIEDGNRNIPALAIHDVYKFLESPLMKTIKNG